MMTANKMINQSLTANYIQKPIITPTNLLKGRLKCQIKDKIPKRLFKTINKREDGPKTKLKNCIR